MNGIYFDNTHSFYNLNLVLSQVNIPPTKPKTTYVDIPGADGSIDLTEALGEVRYKDRECSFTFTVFPYDDFEEKKREVSNLLNGVRCKIVLDKDPQYYWVGRCAVDNYKSDKNLHSLVVKATVSPYKYKLQPTSVTIPAGDSVTKTLFNGRKSVVPTITATDSATIVFDGNTYDLNAGVHKLLNIELKQGKNQIIVTSNSPVTFTYQEGDL